MAIAGGGTGGHLFPALALARELQRRDPGGGLLIVGARGGVEEHVVPREGFPFRGLPVRGLVGRGIRGTAQSLFLLPRAVVEAGGILREFRPDVAVGVGGYASGPFLLRAVLSAVPTLIHEQNAVPGLTNRILGRMVDRIAISFEDARGFFPQERTTLTGVPVREEILRGDALAARERWGLDPGRVTLLIFGGSQGAHRINTTLLQALPHLRTVRERVQFLHAAGDKDCRGVEAAYRREGMKATVLPFFTEMGEAYAAADLCLCRAGASTIAELTLLGKPALLIPFPHAVGDHQRLNALELVWAGGAQMLLDKDLTAEAVARFVREAVESPERLRAMGERAAARARPDAAARLADLVGELARHA